jgi:hypothetical protein
LGVLAGTLGLLGEGSHMTLPVMAATATAPGQGSSKVSYASDPSPYDGTYAGVFNYDYRERIPKKGAPAGFGAYDLSDWASATLTLTLTFKTADGFSEQMAKSAGQWLLQVTKVVASDKGFGTGLEGIVPDYVSTVIPGTGSTAHLPIIGVTGSGILAQTPSFIQVAFPNGSYFRTANVKDDLQVGFAQSTLSGSTWYAQAGTVGALSAENMPGTSGTLAPRRYEVSFKSWNLKKITSWGTAITTPSSTLKDVSGAVEVYSRRLGEPGWAAYKDGAVLNGSSLMPGNRISTGANGRVTLEMADGETITLGPDTMIIMDWFGGNRRIIVDLGKIRYWHRKATAPNVGATETSVDDVVLGGKGTEYTLEVDTARIITVMVIEGAVSVTDTRNENSITLIANQRLSIPKTQTGFSQQDMLGRVKYLPPDSIDRWWEKDTASGAAQTSAWYPVAHPDGSLTVGKVDLLGSGARPAAPGFILIFVLVAAVFFLALGRLYAWQLKRRYGKPPTGG